MDVINVATRSAISGSNLRIQDDQRLLENYTAILEKTNQQLGLWSNPYGIAIGVLSILIAIIAIFVAIAIWKNSKEQKDRFAMFIEEQEKMIKQTKENYESKLDELIKEYEKQLKSTGDDKKEIQKVISELRREKASIGVYMSPSASQSLSLGRISSPSIAPLNFTVDAPKALTCTKCGKTFSYWDPAPSVGTITISLGNKQLYCPYCGHPNIS